MHKTSQHMQNTKAQHQQRREKVTWNLQFLSPRFTRKNTMFRAFKSHPECSSSNAIRQQSLAKGNQNHKTVLQSSYLSNSIDTTIPQQSADTELQSALELQHAVVEHIAWMQQFQCTKHLNTCKTQKHSIKERKSPGTFSSTPRAGREDFTVKRGRPQPSRKRANFSLQPNLRLHEKTQCFVQILTFKSHP